MDDPKETTTTQEAREAMDRQRETGTSNKEQAKEFEKMDAADEFKPEPPPAPEPASDPEADRRDSTPQYPI